MHELSTESALNNRKQLTMIIAPSRIARRNWILICGALPLIGIAICSLPGPISPPARIPEAQRLRMKARLRVRVAADAAVRFRSVFGKTPNNAGELNRALMLMIPSKDPNNEWAFQRQIVDPWGTALSVRETPESLTITSAGPDKIMGTEDDISKTLDFQDPSVENVAPSFRPSNNMRERK